MARSMFGGGPEDVYLVAGDEGYLQQRGGVVIRMYSTETGDTPITDLLDINDSPISYVITSDGSDGRAVGQIAPFFGPDDDQTEEMWAGADGQPRFLLQASDLGSRLGPIGPAFTQHAAQANGHGTRLQDLVDVNTASLEDAGDGYVIARDTASGLWVAEPGGTGGGGGTPENMATLDTAQTITAAKTFTGGLTARPAAATGPAVVTQSLLNQSGNVEEWRDSNGTLRAWMTSSFALRAPNLAQTVTFTKSGAVSTGLGTYRFYNDTGATLTILAVRASVGTASTSGLPTFDVNRNGTTIFTDQSTRPKISVGAVTSGKVTAFAVTTLADGDYLTADVDVAGTGTADLVLQITVA